MQDVNTLHSDIDTANSVTEMVWVILGVLGIFLSVGLGLAGLLSEWVAVPGFVLSIFVVAASDRELRHGLGLFENYKNRGLLFGPQFGKTWLRQH